MCIFWGQIYEVVRPLTSLLRLECTLLQNFEALMALTNLAGINDRLRFATRGESLLKVFIQNSLFSFQNITFRILLFILFYIFCILQSYFCRSIHVSLLLLSIKYLDGVKSFHQTCF